MSKSPPAMTPPRVTRSPASELKFSERYGAWALIAGASEGLGAAFARALSERV
jgi:hypothetical protein